MDSDLIPPRRWFPVVFLHSLLVQGVTFAFRPALVYAMIAAEAPVWMLGVMAASFSTPALLLALPMGRFVDVRGERRGALVGSGLVLVGVLVALVGFHSPWWILAASVLAGAGHLPSMLVGQAQVAHLAPASRMDTVFGHYSLAASFGQLLGPFLLNLPGGEAAMPPLRAVFLACVGVAVALVVTSALFVHRPQRGSVEEKVGLLREAGGLLRTRGVLLALVVGAVPVAVLDLYQVYWPAMGVERGYDVMFVSAMLSVRALFSMISRFFMGRLVRWQGRLRVLATSMVLAGCALGAAVAPVPLSVVVASTVVFGFGLGLCQPLGMAILVVLTPDHNRGVSVSLRLAMNRVGQIVTPLALGGLAGALGSAGVLGASAVLLAVSAAGVRLLPASRASE